VFQVQKAISSPSRTSRQTTVAITIYPSRTALGPSPAASPKSRWFFLHPFQVLHSRTAPLNVACTILRLPPQHPAPHQSHINGAWTTSLSRAQPTPAYPLQTSTYQTTPSHWSSPIFMAVSQATPS